MMVESRCCKGAKLRLHRIAQEEISSMEKKILKWIGVLKEYDPMNFMSQIDEELLCMKKKIRKRIARINKDGKHDSVDKQLKLQFMSKISPKILTGEDIKAEGDVNMEVALVDVSTGEIEEVEPEASVSVEIVLLKEEPDASEGDTWTAEEFKENIVRDMEVKTSLLAGNTNIELRKGVGVVKSIKLKHQAFDDRANKLKPLKFHLGARAVDPSYRDLIKEAKTDLFTVKNYRSKYYYKRSIPSLKDEVYRLENIRKGGPIHKRLCDNEIETVEDFLILHQRDFKGLKRIVGKKWKVALDHAKKCEDKRLRCYADHQQKMAIVFNIFGVVQPQYLNNRHAPTNLPSEIHKVQAESEVHESLLASAYENWKDIKHFDDSNALLEHLACLHRSWDPPELPVQDYPLNKQMPDYPSCNHANMTGENSVDDSILVIDGVEICDNFVVEVPDPHLNTEAAPDNIIVEVPEAPSNTEAAPLETSQEISRGYTPLSDPPYCSHLNPTGEISVDGCNPTIGSVDICDDFLLDIPYSPFNPETTPDDPSPFSDLNLTEEIPVDVYIPTIEEVLMYANQPPAFDNRCEAGSPVHEPNADGHIDAAAATVGFVESQVVHNWPDIEIPDNSIA